MRQLTVLALAASMLALGGATAASPEAPPHYQLKARITPARRVSAVVTIVMPAAQVGHEVTFAIADRFNLRKVDGGPGAVISYGALDRPLHHLRKIVFDYKTAPDHPVTLTFAYDGPLADTTDTDGHVRKDMMELGVETGWFPFDPTLALQFSSDVDITGVPAAMTVVAQGTIHHVGDRLRIHRASTDLDIPIAAATGLKRATSPDFEIYARNLDDPFVRVYRKTAGPAFTYFTKLYGPITAPTPIRMVVAPRGGGGYERRSFISVGDGADDLKANPHFAEYDPARHIAHEIGHGWWWNIPPQSNDYWMVESMAEFSALRYIREAYGEDAFKVLLDRKRASAAKAGPILTGDARKPNNAVLYSKGPLLLFELEGHIGRPKMDDFLGVIGRHTPRSTAELLKALSDVAGPEAAHAFEASLRS